MYNDWRKLLIITCDDLTTPPALHSLPQHMMGDWVVISTQLAHFTWSSQQVLPQQAKQLLGQEFQHAVFDARQGFNLDAFAILTGTLIKGSCLILLLPKITQNWQDQDSLRWNEQDEPIRVVNFLTHLWQTIDANLSTDVVCYQHDINHNDLLAWIISCYYSSTTSLTSTKPAAEFDHYAQQRQLLEILPSTDADIVMLTAKRGRGKSALAGMFSQTCVCWVTAPNQQAITTLKRFASQPVIFIAPDELILRMQQLDERPQWLIIDEAAMIPLPLLAQLITLATTRLATTVSTTKVLLTTTVDGYEGTGQGLLLKLFNDLTEQYKVLALTLTDPIRWLPNDPLEAFTEQLLFTDGELDSNRTNIDVHIDASVVNQIEIGYYPRSEKQTAPQLIPFKQIFNLLKQAHYRTSLIDLRRLFDARNLTIFTAQYQNNILGTVVTINEGELADDLIEQVWQGVRRPKGNLVAQSLVAHAGNKLAAKLKSVRINRIAVASAWRRQGIATKLLQQVVWQAQQHHCDYVSVSFCYSLAMAQFWQQQQFHLVHIGSQKEASSGGYAAMAIYPLSEQGLFLCNNMVANLARNWQCYQYYIDIDLAINMNSDLALTERDWQTLHGFADSHHAYEAALPALYRLAARLFTVDLQMQQYPLLKVTQIERQSDYVIMQRLGLVGKKQLINTLRQEVKCYLATNKQI